MRPSGSAASPAPAASTPGPNLAAAAAIRDFLARHDAVEVCEGGRRLACLRAADSGFSLSTDQGRLVCHFWTHEANLVRRVLEVTAKPNAQALRLLCLRLGQSHPSPLLLSAGNDANPGAASQREEFRQAVVAAAEREWHGWRLQPAGIRGAAASHAGLQRLLFRHGPALLPCLAASEYESAATLDQALEHALAWTAAVRSRWPGGLVAAVRLILPPGAEASVAARLRWLRQPPAFPAIECYRLDRSAGQLDPLLDSVDLADDGNLASRLRRAPQRPSGPDAAFRPALAAEADALLAEIREACPQTTLELSPDGGWVFRLYGLEIVRQAAAAEVFSSPFTFGCGHEQSPLLASTRPLFAQFLALLGAQRVPGGDRRDPFYALQPERWMEHLLRSDPACLDPQVDRRFVYSQVPLCRGGDRDRLDLLALDRAGRLLVLELKADEDLGFPLQALDYWRRVRHHQLAGDFTRLGYFPGVEISPLPPRLWLIAPALRWHPQADAVGAWLSPQIACTRIGLNEEWRRGIQVLERKESPYG